MKSPVNAVIAGCAGLTIFLSRRLFNHPPCYGNYDDERVRRTRHPAVTAAIAGYSERELDYHYHPERQWYCSAAHCNASHCVCSAQSEHYNSNH
jgi:hypothetical protein